MRTKEQSLEWRKWFDHATREYVCQVFIYNVGDISEVRQRDDYGLVQNAYDKAVAFLKEWPQYPELIKEKHHG